MKTFCVIGKIGSGKSTVCGLLAEIAEEKDLRVRYVDLDNVAKQVMQNPQIKAKIAEAFGGVSTREDLAAAAFADEDSTQKLNKIVHPAVFDALQVQIEVANNEDVDIFIFEESAWTGPNDKFSALAGKLIFVYTPDYVRRELALARGMRLEDFKKRDARQPSQQTMEDAADITVRNTSTVETLRSTLARII